jgi:acyl carrier protein
MKEVLMQVTLTREYVTQRLCHLAAEQAVVNPAEVTAETHLFLDLNFDSLDAVEYVMSIEDEFEISISDDEAAKVKTVGQAVDLLLPLLMGTSGPER